MRYLRKYFNIILSKRKRYFYFALLLMLLTLSLTVYKKYHRDLYSLKSKAIDYIFEKLDLNHDIKIVVSGVMRSDEEKIKEITQSTLQSNDGISSSTHVKLLIKKLKKSQKWIDSIHVFRTLPNHLNIRITEYSPFAIWNDDGISYVVDSNGNKVAVNNIEQFEGLLILSGSDAYSHVKSLFNLMVINPDISSKIYSATWVGNRRWDLRLDDSVLVKLPAEKISDSWSELVKLYNSKGSFFNLKTIDLRIRGKIYLEYKT